MADSKLKPKPRRRKRTIRASSAGTPAALGGGAASASSAGAGIVGASEPGIAGTAGASEPVVGAQEPKKDSAPEPVIRIKDESGRPEPPRAQKIPRTRTRAERIETAKTSTMAIVLTVDGVVGAALGPECKMTPVEQQMIVGPLQELIERLTPEQAEALETYTTPLALVVGLAAWLMRILTVMRERAAVDKQQQELAAQPEPGGNGTGRSVSLGPIAPGDVALGRA